MDHMVQCSTLVFVEHIVLGFFGMCSTVMGVFLVQRRIRADRLQAKAHCKRCEYHHGHSRHDELNRREAELKSKV